MGIETIDTEICIEGVNGQLLFTCSRLQFPFPSGFACKLRIDFTPEMLEEIISNSE